MNNSLLPNQKIMKRFLQFCTLSVVLLFLFSCHTSKKIITKAIAPKDTAAAVVIVHTSADSLLMQNTAMEKLRHHHIDFNTFNAKIKVEYEDAKGSHPDITAIVRIVKDSAIWMSITVPIAFVNFEAFRVLINKDSVILLDKQHKEVQYRSIDYLQDVTDIPFDFKTLQDLLIGNPIFLDSNIVSYRKIENKLLISTAGNLFKHLLTLSADNYFLLHSKLDDVDFTRNRTADITYSAFENKNGIDFSTYREITVSEKNKVDIRLNFKQYEFNKELSVYFNIPKNYKRK